MKEKFITKFKKIFEILIITNLIIYAFYSALFFKAGTSYAKNLPVIKADNIEAILRPKVENMAKATEAVMSNNANAIVDPPKYNRFPWGQCTWYVATKRNVTWNGNARDWYRNAKAAGRSVGKIPKVGSIVVLNMGYYGHVGYVESVKGDLFTYSETNIVGLGRISRATVNVRQIPLIGFIY